jgi:hypothetical protein
MCKSVVAVRGVATGPVTITPGTGLGQTRAMTSTTPIYRRPAAALFAGALLLTACGTSGGSDSAKKSTTTTTEAKADKTTTTTEVEKTTTTTEAEGPTLDELEGILPAADEFGEGWTDDDSEKGPDLAIETATEDECPDAAALLSPPEDGEATAGYIGPDQETVRITLTGGVDTLASDDIQAAVDSINDCDTVTAEEDGLTFTVAFEAAPNTDYGDGGVQISAAVNITDGTDSYDVTKYRVIYTVGDIGIVITGGDGLADDGTVTPIDQAGLDAVAVEMADRAKQF